MVRCRFGYLEDRTAVQSGIEPLQTTIQSGLDPSRSDDPKRRQAAALHKTKAPNSPGTLSDRGKLARWAWSLAWLAYLVHVVFAMKFAHHWSHAEAIQHTQERSGFGAGIWFSHFFTLLWTLDVGWWWLWPVAYARRSPWVDRLLHAYMVFIIFCGTVVYETGFVRWAGVVMFVVLGGALAYRSQALWRAPGRNPDVCSHRHTSGSRPDARRSEHL
jgi:hypothetical protein